MYVRKIEGVRIVRGQDGQIISRADLPKAGGSRWVASRKAIVVDAVRGGLITAKEAQERYRISASEWAAWEAAAAKFGVRGLHSKTLPRPERKALPGSVAGKPIHIGDLCVDIGAREVRLDNEVLPVRGIDFRVLSRLALNAGEVVTRAEVLSHLYGDADGAEQRILNVVICRLRAILEDASGGTDGPCIETVWGRGYALHGRRTGRKCHASD